MKNTKTGIVPQAKYRLVGSANGVSLVSSYRGLTQGGKVHMRGKVEGFSRASARRLRHLLFGLDYSGAVAVTLTHPVVIDGMRGPEASFEALGRIANRFPWLRALVWRKEVQRNGNAHYHCILWPSEGVDGAEAGENLVQAWIDACLKSWAMPSCFVERTRRDMQMAHHYEKRPCIVQMEGSCYVRYILDHESKHKQEQAQTKGRPWGVWNRSRLPLVEGLDCNLTERQYWAAARIMRKACRYSIKAGCLFGWKHTSGRRATGLGTVDYFGRTNDGGLAHKIMPFVKSDAFEPSPVDVYAQGRFYRRQHCQDEDRLSPLD